jgi:HAD superfamily hydrolase (TIGR01509 family)
MPAPLFPPRAILFDHDGVLAASEVLHMLAWEKMLLEKGIPFRREDFHDQIGKTSPEILVTLAAKHKPHLRLSPDQIYEWTDLKNVYYRHLLQEGPGMAPYPGVPEGLAKMKQMGIQAAVVSNARRNELVAGLQATGLFPHFAAIVARDDVPAPKPDPGHFLAACHLIGVEPSQCIGIDDSPTGLQSSLLAKIPTATVTNSFPRKHLEQPVPGRPDLKPFRIFSSMEEFFATVLAPNR